MQSTTALDLALLDHPVSGKAAEVQYHFDAEFAFLQELVPQDNTILITDELVHESHQALFEGWKTIVIPAGEQFKQQDTVDSIIQELLKMQADRSTWLVGVGGGVVTDMTGYVAGIYLRGLPFGFVPTTILAMVDAAIGGKNGVDVGKVKNMVGLIRQPSFLLFDYSLLKTLPQPQWVNGFAEIIKHAAILDATLFQQLEKKDLAFYQQHQKELDALVQQNVRLKTKVVLQDELEQGNRKWLNFGHTLGHAIENEYQLLHGEAISIGMAVAGNIAQQHCNFPAADHQRLIQLLQRYGLPTQWSIQLEQAWELMMLDKKKAGKFINYILLEEIGKAVIAPLSPEELKPLLTQAIHSVYYTDEQQQPL